ncbi:unnamed protein product [Effrenium voratum]|uniref:Piwi domain-containing protein n=1 Tax=Effrenium voratum TaxID=2562239 RepID=A0AA36IZ56_9DINO|nr:unnamed protein product [Effrenium voratum]
MDQDFPELPNKGGKDSGREAAKGAWGAGKGGKELGKGSVGKEGRKDMGKSPTGKEGGKDMGGKDMGKGPMGKEGGKDMGKGPMGKEGGKEMGKEGGKDMGKGFMGKEGGKEMGKEGGKDMGKGLMGKEGAKEMGKGPMGKEGGKEMGKEGGKDMGKGPMGKEGGKEMGKEGGKDMGKGPMGKEGGKEMGKEGGKDMGKGPMGKEGGKEMGKEGGKDMGKGFMGKEGGKDTGKGPMGKEGVAKGGNPWGKSIPQASAPSAPPAFAAPMPAPAPSASPPASAPSAPARFGADDYEAAEKADAAAYAAEQKDELQLEMPRLSLGRNGAPMKLVANHFHLSVKPGSQTVWRCWRVDFARVESTPPKESLTKGRAPKAKGDDDRELPKAIRMQAVAVFMSHVPATDWLHDGNNLLYTRKSVTSVSDARKELEVPASSGKKAFKVAIQVRFEDREIDLAWLAKPKDQEKGAEEASEAMSEHRRFVQVAIRTLALEKEALIAQGRKVVCPDKRLICDAFPLKYGREMWFGYIGQVEVVNGGMSSSGIAPPRTTLSLNLVASIGIPQMSVIDLLGKLGAKYQGDWRSEQDCARDVVNRYWDRSYGYLRDALRGDMGLRKLKAMAEYGQVKVSGKKIDGITDKPANRVEFDCAEMGDRKVNVVDYFWHKHNIRVQYPELPCIQLGNPRNCIPMEFVYVMGGEHNLAVGRLRPEFQQEVTRRTAMPPTQRRDYIVSALNNKELGPSAALKQKGVDVDMQMLSLTGRHLEAPRLKDGASEYLSVNYSNTFKSVAPPKFQVSWGMWCFTHGRTSQRDIDWLAEEFVNKTKSKNLNFGQPKFVEWPEKAFAAYYEGIKRRESFYPKLGEALRADLKQLQAKHKDLKLMVVLLEDSEAITDHLYKLMKLITETEIGAFVTQFINCKKGISDAEKKFNNIMLKVTPKVPLTMTASRSAYNVTLVQPHGLLKPQEDTMIMGADVTHAVAGISVAGVVASTDSNYASYFHEIRGQSPFTLNTLKQRKRQSEERIVDLAGMTKCLLTCWKQCNGKLPKTIIYYRDGVSDGQFVKVLTRELNLLDQGFKLMEPGYSPQLVIIVGQKRHQTRLWMDGAAGGSKGKGKDDKGKGKGKGKDPAQVPPGTVASDGIAQPSHMNFFLVSQQGIQGTSVPCHYHVLHMDKRLVARKVTVDDFETITYQLCHMYSRADKSVGYATPAYMADHACERGKHYLEAHFGPSSDLQSTLGSSSSEERAMEALKEQIEERTAWLNNLVTRASARARLNGLQLYC